MKKFIILLIGLVFIACSNKDISRGEVTSIDTRVEERKEVLEKGGLYGVWEYVDRKNYFTFEFLEEDLIVSIPSFKVEEKVTYEDKKEEFVVYIDMKVHKMKDDIDGVERYFVYRLLKSLAVGESYIKPEDSISEISYSYYINDDKLILNYASENTIVLKRR